MDDTVTPKPCGMCGGAKRIPVTTVVGAPNAGWADCPQCAKVTTNLQAPPATVELLREAREQLNDTSALTGNLEWQADLGRLVDRIDAHLAKPAETPMQELQRLGQDPGTGDVSDCGHSNPIWFADNSLWNTVMGGPDAKDDPGGILCPTCFMVKAGIPLRVSLPIQPAEQSPGDHSTVPAPKEAESDVEILQEHGVLTDELAARLPVEAREAFYHLTAMTDHRGDGIATQYLYPIEVRDAAVILCATALASSRDDVIEECAKAAMIEGCRQYSKKRRTRSLGIPRDAYPHEVGNDIAQAIRALKDRSNG